MSWAEVKKINSNLDVPLDESIGQKDDVANASGSLHGKLKNLWSRVNANLDRKVSQSGIKSVQRGVVQKDAVNNSSPVNVSISSVDISKSIVVVNATERLRIASGEDHYFGMRAVLTSPTNIQFVREYSSSGNRTAVYAAWQVIEFY